jgi:transcriptional regulator with XRE-family HTH domain
MVEKNNTNWYSRSDPAILEILGHYLQQTRLQQNKTQQSVAEAAGVNRSTVVQIEKGSGGTMLSFIQILRALEQLHLLEGFEFKMQISPIQLAKIEQEKRQRAGRKKKPDSGLKKSSW